MRRAEHLIMLFTIDPRCIIYLFTNAIQTHWRRIWFWPKRIRIYVTFCDGLCLCWVNKHHWESFSWDVMIVAIWYLTMELHQTNFSSNLNYDGKIIHEMVPWSVSDTDQGTISWMILQSGVLYHLSVLHRAQLNIVINNAATRPECIFQSMGLFSDTQNCGLRMRRKCQERFPPPPRVSDPDMHHGTCVTHVPWCMSGSLTSGFLWNRLRGKTFPAFPAHG